MSDIGRIVKSPLLARYLAAALGFLLLDQLTKIAVREWLELGDSVQVIPHVLDLSHWKNTGAAFGMFPAAANVYAIITLVVCVFLAAIGPRLVAGQRLLFWAFTCLLGGAAGNLIDRLRFGGVTDFLDFHVWPVFNVADIALTVGAGLLVLHLIQGERPAVPKEPAP